MSGAGVGQYPLTPEFCVGNTNTLVSENTKICVIPNAKPKICISPNAKPKRKSVEYRWRWVFWRCIFHVYFMYISCCLCIIFRVGYAKISRRKGRFQWNTGFSVWETNMLLSETLEHPTKSPHNQCESQREPLEYRLRLVPLHWGLHWACTFHIFCVDFIRFG